MNLAGLVRRNLTYYWRTNLAVVFGVGVAVAVLAGALLVGESVRASLRGLFLQRLGRTEAVVSSAGFFREQLAEDVRRHEEFGAGGFGEVCPLVALVGAAAHEESGRRGAGVQVYGVDERFWQFHGSAGAASLAPNNREVLLSESLAAELGAKAGDTLLLRIEKPSEIPVESVHGRKEDVGRTLRLTVREALPAASLGEFSVSPRQSAVRAVFVPLGLLQRELKQEGKVNTLLVSAKDSGASNEGRANNAGLENILRASFALEDLGINVRALDERRGLALESESALVNDHLAEAARAAAGKSGMRAAPVLSYLANTVRANGREVPYSLVTAIDAESFEKLRTSGKTETTPGAAASGGPVSSDLPPIVLNEWAARDLEVKGGDEVSLEYYLWQEGGGLLTRSGRFRLAGVVPISGAAADRDLVPSYPGITESANLSDWDPPFPVDLARVRQRDEDYWDEYGTTPKAFITIEAGQPLWQTRFGKLTSMRVTADDGPTADSARETFRANLRGALDPARAGLGVFAARAEGLSASRGATDFGEYFLYFSFFLVVSALMLAALFFRLGVEQRLREIGTLQAVGFPASRIRALFVTEGAALALAGSALGLVGAYAYGWLVMHGLRTWWVGAVGTTALTLTVSPASLVLGAAGGIVAALACVVWTLRRLARSSTRSLLAGTMEEGKGKSVKGAEGKSEGAALRSRFSFSPLRLFASSPAALAVVFGVVGALLLVAAAAGALGQVAGFFGGGSALLVALLCAQAAWLRRRAGSPIRGSGWWPVSRLGVRNATHRPGRSVLCITLIAFASFIIVAVDSFRKDDRAAALDRKSGSGGYQLLAESVLPVVHDPNSAEGREALTIGTSAGEASELEGVRFERFRVRPGDDASCLNLYQPRNPKIVAPTDEFLGAGRFAFHSSLAESNEEKQNPWLLLRREFADGAVPVVADANSMSYVLHVKLGEDFVLEREGAPVRLRLVAALSDSIFQGELLMSEANFKRLFPEQEGARLFLLDVEEAKAERVATTLEERLGDFGFDVTRTSERLANFHRVENTFLSTFQTLGGLGLALGTLGLAAVLLRNVLERRRELALLRAVGYGQRHFALMVVAENALLLFCGLLTGTACALLAVAPVVASRGGRLPVASLGALLLAVILSGMVASLLATVAALRSPLLASLRAE